MVDEMILEDTDRLEMIVNEIWRMISSDFRIFKGIFKDFVECQTFCKI